MDEREKRSIMEKVKGHRRGDRSSGRADGKNRSGEGLAVGRLVEAF